MMSMKEAAKLFQAAASEHRLHDAKLLALEIIGQMVEGEAKHVIGTYEFDWPQLTASTQHDRERKGYDPNEPLLRTGELRDSVEHQVDDQEMSVEIGVPEGVPHSGSGASVGEIAVFQEFGTATIPPRPFLGPALFYLLGKGEIQDVVREIIGSAILANHLDHAILDTVLDGLHSLHNIAKILPDMVQQNEDEQQND